MQEGLTLKSSMCVPCSCNTKYAENWCR